MINKHTGIDAMDGAISLLEALCVEPYHDFMLKAKKLYMQMNTLTNHVVIKEK